MDHYQNCAEAIGNEKAQEFVSKSDGLADNFRYHKPGEIVEKKHEEVRHSCYQLAQTLHRILPPSREAALVQTKIEEAMFWANAAIARNQK